MNLVLIWKIHFQGHSFQTIIRKRLDSLFQFKIGDLTPEEIKNELHPLYKNNEIKDEQQIHKALVDMDVADAKEDFKIKISEANKKYEEELLKR